MINRKPLSYFAIGLLIAALIGVGKTPLYVIPHVLAQPELSTPTCLASQPHTESGGSDRLIHRYVGTDIDYWLYYTYGASDTRQQSAMEMIIITTGNRCELAYWNAAGNSFAYSDVVPMDVARQFSLAGFQGHLDIVGKRDFEAFYAVADPSQFYEEELWALQQLGINLQQ